MSNLIEALVRQGFQDISISNSHGGNIVAMHQILDELSPVLDATPVATTYAMEAGPAFNAVLEDQETIQHACEAETSMMMVCKPEPVDDSDLASLATTERNGSDFLQVGRKSYRWRPFASTTASGLLKIPTRSSEAKGEQLLEIGAQALTDLSVDPNTWIAPQALHPGHRCAEPAEREEDRTGGYAGKTRDRAARVDHAEPEKAAEAQIVTCVPIPSEWANSTRAANCSAVSSMLRCARWGRCTQTAGNPWWVAVGTGRPSVGAC